MTIRRRGRGYESQQYLKGVVGKACNRSRPVRTEKEGYDLNYSTKIATKKKKKKILSIERTDRKIGYCKQNSCKHIPGTDLSIAGER